MTPNTEPIPATDAEPNPASDWFVYQVKANDYGVWRHGAKILVDRIEQEREMRRELKTALVRLSCHPCRFYTGTWVVCKGEDTSKMCDMCAARTALARAAKMEADNGIQ